MKSKIDTSWDVMKYKYHYELEHQWELKRKFIEAHKSKYEEDRLICLAQLFCNVHFMGCSYEDNIMELINELSEGLAKKATKWQKQSFVTASSAVEDRVKGRLQAQGRVAVGQRQESWAAGQSKSIKFVQDSVQDAAEKSENEVCSVARKRPAPPPPPEEDQFFRNKRLKNNFTRSQIDEELSYVVDSGPFGRVVLFQSAVVTESNVAIMERTAAAAQMNINYLSTPPPPGSSDITCKVLLENMFLSSASGPTQKMAKDLACKLAIENLKETSFTILVKASFTKDAEEVDRDLSASTASTNKPITDDNIGNKMLRLMGWGGGGLGKNQQGIEEPIAASGSVKREGLGSNEGAFKQKIHALLKDYIAGTNKNDLVFSSGFTKEERKFIHEASRKYNLKSRSYGADENRHLVLFKKARPLEIVEDLLMCGCETLKYKLLPPKSMIDRFTV